MIDRLVALTNHPSPASLLFGDFYPIFMIVVDDDDDDDDGDDGDGGIGICCYGAQLLSGLCSHCSSAFPGSVWLLLLLLLLLLMNHNSHILLIRNFLLVGGDRRKYQVRVQRKMDAIHATMERLYQIRHSNTYDAQDVLMQTKVCIEQIQPNPTQPNLANQTNRLSISID
jgi:hypothetical protein